MTYACNFSFRCARWNWSKAKAHLGHATVNYKVGAIDEATLVTGEEQHRLRLLDGFTESARGEVNFPTVTLCLIITQPVLQ